MAQDRPAPTMVLNHAHLIVSNTLFIVSLQDNNFIPIIFTYCLFNPDDMCLFTALAADFIKTYASIFDVIRQVNQFLIHFLVPIIVEVTFKYAVLNPDTIVFQFFCNLSPQLIA